MKFISRNLKYIATAFFTAAIGISATTAFAQAPSVKANVKTGYEHKDKDKGFCQNWNWSSDNKVSFADLRELTAAAGGTITVDAGKNGGVSVVGEDRNDVAIKACIQAWGTTEEAAKAAAAGIRINTSGTIKAESSVDENWSVSFQLTVPRQSNLKLNAHNGGISIANVDGMIDFETQNGGVSLENLAGDVTGSTKNGGLNVMLAGTSWRGNGLNATTTNGGVNLTLSKNYSANLETGTVNGGYKSDIPALNITTEEIKGGWKTRPTRIQTNLNGGGAPVKVITTNGGIKINAVENE
ncbi:MAG: hypothetical protein IPO41_14980 [Acidobacteria bacterium]|nr:hypothetical protein [Acidobacteriota bacterium]MBK9529573.1 hypothetical protein [Acidobacteriota bacterium]MBP7473649.1 hypothetical protein [Pyrinomonadaceae bacterium]MBP9108173.1 hypothetical protein [Pyrinomonadaceae bacterium]